MPANLAEEFSAAMTALLAAASASDARKWMNVASEIRELQSRCSAVLRLIEDEAEADAIAIDGAGWASKAYASRQWW
jgi:hypothetical protein